MLQIVDTGQFLQFFHYNICSILSLTSSPISYNNWAHSYDQSVPHSKPPQSSSSIFQNAKHIWINHALNTMNANDNLHKFILQL